MDRSATRKRRAESTAQQLVLPGEPDGGNCAAHPFACSYITGRVWARNDSRAL